MAMSLGAGLKLVSEGATAVKPFEGGFFDKLIDCAYAGNAFMPTSQLGEGTIKMLKSNNINVRTLKYNGRQIQVIVWGNITDSSMIKILKEKGFI